MKTKFSRILERFTGLSLALLLGAGFWFVIWYASFVVEPLLPTVESNETAGRWDIPMFTREGELHLVIPSKDQFFLNYGGQVIQMPNSARRIDPLANSPGTTIEKLAPSTEWIEYPNGVKISEGQLNSFTNGGSQMEFWYLVRNLHPRTHGYFIGYEKKSKKLIGYIGKNGLQASRPSWEESLPLTESYFGVASGGTTQVSPEILPTPWTESDPREFALQTNRKIWMSTVDGIWLCDLGTRSVRPVAPIQEVQGLHVMVDPKGWHQKVLARTKDGVHVFDESGKEISRVEYPFSGNDFLTLSLTDSGNSILVVTKYPGWVKEASRSVSILWFDATGKKIREWNQPLKYFPFEEGHFGTTKPIISTRTTVMALGGTIVEMSRAIRRTMVSDQDWFPVEPISYRIFGAVVTIFAIAWLWWHQARNRVSKTQVMIWTGFVLLFGLTGLLGYHFHKRWPALVRCQVCGHKDFIGRTECSSCGHIDPEPAILGRDLVEAEPTLTFAQSA